MNNKCEVPTEVGGFLTHLSLSSHAGGQKQDLGKCHHQRAAPTLPSPVAVAAACTYFSAAAASCFFAGMVLASNITTIIVKEVFLLHFLFNFNRAHFSYRQDLPIWL